MQSSPVISESPSFACHSSNNLADVAARVIEEFRHENGDDYDGSFNFNDDDYHHNRLSVPADDEAPEKLKDKEEDCDADADDDEFEFAVVCNSSSISADEIFSNGHIMPRYPLFDTSLLSDVDPDFDKVVDGSAETDCKPSAIIRVSLRKLLSEERDSPSCSSSEADDLNGVAPGTYCVWKPKAEQPGRCKKSNSTGNTSRPWKLRDILYRTNSGDKETSFLLLRSLLAMNKKMNNEKVKKVEKTAKVAAAVGDGASAVATEQTDPANNAQNGGNRRRSFGQDLVGALANVNGLSRNLHPF